MFLPWHQHQTEPWFWPGTWAGWALLSAEGSSFCASSFPEWPQDFCHFIFCSWAQKGVCEPRVGGSVLAVLNEACNLFERLANNVQSLFGFLSGAECIGHLFSPGGAGRGDLLSSLSSLSMPLNVSKHPALSSAQLFSSLPTTTSSCRCTLSPSPPWEPPALLSPIPASCTGSATCTGWCVTTITTWVMTSVNLSGFPSLLLFYFHPQSPAPVTVGWFAWAGWHQLLFFGIVLYSHVFRAYFH